MKKLLSPKKNYMKNEYYVRLRGDPPKRMVTPTWTIRNDSSNINSILKPENHIQSSRQSGDKGVYKKCFLGENTCYCMEKKIRPKLMSRPRSCLSLESFKNKFQDAGLLRRPLEQDYVLQECCCKDVAGGSTDSTDSVLLKRYRDDLENKCSCLEYTESRKDYNEFREKQNEEDLKEIEKFDELVDVAKEAEGEEEGEEENENDHRGEEEEENEEEYKGEEKEDHSVLTIMGTRHGTTKTTLSSFLRDEDEAVASTQSLNVFRNEHYFETHSTENLGKVVPRHTCVHQYRLDDRLLPEPLNVDPFGRSTCSICSKPMEGDTMQLSKSYFSDKPSSVVLRNLAKCSELGLVPRSISIGGDKSKIELRVSSREKNKLGMFVGRIRRPEYFNTFALRQQRMSC